MRGLGASDMKGACAVMVELALAGAPAGCLFFGREELPLGESALTPLLERARDELAAELAVVMEPTDNELHAGCLGNLNATWTFRGRSGHSARPWLADNAIERAAAGIAALAAHPPYPHDDRRAGVRGGRHGHEGERRHRAQRGARRGGVQRELPLRAGAQSPEEAEARLRELCGGHGELVVDGNAPSGTVAVTAPLAQALIAAGDLDGRAEAGVDPGGRARRRGDRGGELRPGRHRPGAPPRRARARSTRSCARTACSSASCGRR